MAGVGTYLNFPGTCDEVFQFYKSVFGGEFTSVMRTGDMPPPPGAPALTDAQKKRIMHIALPIVGGHVLMGSDTPELQQKLVVGNNVYISLWIDSKEEADRLYKALSEGGKTEMAPADQFWGDYWGSWADKYGTQWMVTVLGKKK